MLKARISEIFRSIQGEGLYVGCPTIFVRFYDCNLRCVYCDTKQDSWEALSQEQVLDRIMALKDNIKFVSFTGGEPLLEVDFLKKMLPLTRDRGFKNYLETNATLHENLRGVIEFVDIISADLKLPTSTQLKPFWEEHRRFIQMAIKHHKDIFLKAVITLYTEEEDLEKMLVLIEELDRNLTLVLQPNTDEWGPSLIAKLERFQEVCSKRINNLRLIPQVHRLLGLR